MVFSSNQEYLQFFRSDPVEPKKYEEPQEVKPEETPEEPAGEKPKRRKKA